MSINFVPTEISNLVRLMKITVTAGESVTILCRNKTTGVLSSAYLTPHQLALLQERTDKLWPAIQSDAALVSRLLQTLISITDGTGVVAPRSQVVGGVENLDLIGFVNGQPAYVLAVIPHSSGGGFAAVSDIAQGTIEDITLQVGVEADNVIRVSGQTNNSHGVPESIIIRIRAAGAGTPIMSVVTGTSIKNNGNELWMRTNASGQFAVDVSDAVVETVLFSVELNNGTNSLAELSFA